MTREIIRVLSMVGVVALSACNTGPLQPGEAGELGLSEAGTIESDGALTLLHKEVVENGHAVEFYEFVDEPGLILISEEGPANTEPVLAGREGRTVTESFKVIRPRAQLPRRLAEAQMRQDRFLAMADPDAYIVERQEPGMQPMRAVSGTDNSSLTRFLDWTSMQTGYGNAPGSGCDRHWFEWFCDRNIWSHSNDSVLFYPNTRRSTFHREDNIRYAFDMAVCSDTGDIRFGFSVRKAFSWKQRINTVVSEGYYRWVYFSTGGNRHDFAASMSSVGDVDDYLYHYCVGIED